MAPGTTFLGANEVLPPLASVDHMAAVQRDAGVYQVSGATVRRTPYVPSEQTGGIGVDATDPGLLAAVGGQLATGQFLSSANESFPTVVLGAGRKHAPDPERRWPPGPTRCRRTSRW